MLNTVLFSGCACPALVSGWDPKTEMKWSKRNPTKPKRTCAKKPNKQLVTMSSKILPSAVASVPALTHNGHANTNGTMSEGLFSSAVKAIHDREKQRIYENNHCYQNNQRHSNGLGGETAKPKVIFKPRLVPLLLLLSFEISKRVLFLHQHQHHDYSSTHH